jgi:hypothetical protein
MHCLSIVLTQKHRSASKRNHTKQLPHPPAVWRHSSTAPEPHRGSYSLCELASTNEPAGELHTCRCQAVMIWLPAPSHRALLHLRRPQSSWARYAVGSLPSMHEPNAGMACQRDKPRVDSIALPPDLTRHRCPASPICSDHPGCVQIAHHSLVWVLPWMMHGGWAALAGWVGYMITQVRSQTQTSLAALCQHPPDATPSS